MADYRGIDLIDYLILLIKKKWIVVSLSISVFVLSYLVIFFFVEEQFEAKAVIIPAEDDRLSSLSTMLKGFSSLPLGLDNLKKNSDTDLYKTIIYSRTNLESVIKKFYLFEEYGLNSLEKTIRVLEDKIETKETKEGAFEISVVASSRQKCAKMTNYIVDRLNETIVELNISKSRENRIFLKSRYEEIKENLKKSEDSLKVFQEKSKMYMAEDQTKAIIENFSKLEADLAAKQIEMNVLEKIYGIESPQANNAKVAVLEYNSKLNSLKAGRENQSFLLAINSLPKESMLYFRFYRDVMINNKMLEIILPLYESAKFQEKKDTPILQVIDRAVPPELKAYPKRVFSAFLITIGFMFFVMSYLFINEFISNSQNPKIIFLREEFRFRKKMNHN